MSTKKIQILGTSLGNNVYTQPEEPTDAPDGSLWVDTDAEAQSNSVRIDASLTIEGQAADAKATGDAIRSLSEETDPTVPDWAKQPTKPSYTAEEVGALPINTVIPTVPDNVSAFRNDAGYLTEHQDISGKLDASELPTAINTALAQAKASGEFDGADGIGIQSVEQTTTSTEDGGTNVVTVTRTDGTSSTFQIKNGSRGQDATVDASLTQSGKAADAAVVGQRLSTLSEEIVTTSESKVYAHNTGTDTHSDIRLLISGLTDRINALADSDDTTLDQLSEVVAYIKSNRTLIESITTNKVSVADIVDNLATNVANKPLSAAQGVALKTLIDAIIVPDKLPNPNALTFTGAVTGSYDGSAPLSVEIPSSGGSSSGGSGKAKSQIIIDQEITELTASLSVTLEHDFHNLTAIISCGSDGAALTAGSDGTAVASKIGLLIDTTSFSYNSRKVAYVDTSSTTWQTRMIGAEWSDDLSVFKLGFKVEVAMGTSGKYYDFPFGGTAAMYGTLGTDDNAPRTGKTANIVVNGAYLNVGTRVVLWGEYYE